MISRSPVTGKLWLVNGPTQSSLNSGGSKTTGTGGGVGTPCAIVVAAMTIAGAIPQRNTHFETLDELIAVSF